jgi:LytS/YehU family sensor histidine kinase
LVYILAYVFLFALVFYTSLLVFPLFSSPKGIITGTLATLLMFAGLSTFAYFYTYKLLPSFGVKLYLRPDFNLGQYLANSIKLFVQYFIFALLYFIIRKWLRKERQLRNMQQEYFLLEQEKKLKELEKIRYEYAFLRAQINPHFLHNTLNILFAQALPHSQELADNIFKLSSIMRYSLESATIEDGIVSIREELEHLQTLIDIHQIRFSNILNIDYQVTGDICNHVLPPLSLITAVENAFKYGDLKDPSYPLTILISLNPGEIVFYCANKKKKGRIRFPSHSMGIDNLSRRLDITFKNRYTIQARNLENEYIFELTIKN